MTNLIHRCSPNLTPNQDTYFKFQNGMDALPTLTCARSIENLCSSCFDGSISIPDLRGHALSISCASSTTGGVIGVFGRLNPSS